MTEMVSSLMVAIDSWLVGCKSAGFDESIDSGKMKHAAPVSTKNRVPIR